MSRFRYEQLASEKYWIASLELQLREANRSRFRQNMRTVMWAGLSLTVLAVGFYTMPLWVTAIIEFLDSNGW